MHESICGMKEIEGIKMILYVEHTVMQMILPLHYGGFAITLIRKEIISFVQRLRMLTGKTVACIGLDGTRKTKALDNFQRDWPNIIVADDKTINTVDEKWAGLGIGKFIPSPSLKFKEQLYGEDAVSA